MSNNLINREEFRKHYCKINCGGRQCVDHADRCSFIDELMQFKTEPERSEGEWEFVADDKANLQFIYKCSECGREVSLYDASTLLKIYPFCHCGARMKVSAE